MTVLGFLHTAQQHVETFEALVALRPEDRAVHVVDAALLEQAQVLGVEAVRPAVGERVAELRARGAERVICTCSTLGAVAEDVGGEGVVRVDRAMARAAVRSADRIGVVVALDSTVGPTTALLGEEARRAGRSPEVRVAMADGAWARWEAGDHSGYLDVVAEVAAGMLGDVDVVVLAQASMAGAVELVGESGTPVLASPQAAVAAALRSATGQPTESRTTP